MPELQAVNMRCLEKASLEPKVHSALAEALRRTCAFAEGINAHENERFVRQIASALYHITSAIGLAHEAAKIGAPHRLALASMVLKHRLLPRDPLVQDDDVDMLPAVLEA